MAYTAGPWEYTSIPGYLFELRNTNGDIILRLRGGITPTVGDARLMRTAPELLEACKLAFEAFGSSGATDHQKALALVALESACGRAEAERGY